MVPVLFGHYILMKMFHFSDAHLLAHKAVDKYLVKYLDQLDRLLESLQGTWGSGVRLPTQEMDLRLRMVDDVDGATNLARFRDVLRNLPTRESETP